MRTEQEEGGVAGVGRDAGTIACRSDRRQRVLRRWRFVRARLVRGGIRPFVFEEQDILGEPLVAEPNLVLALVHGKFPLFSLLVTAVRHPPRGVPIEQDEAARFVGQADDLSLRVPRAREARDGGGEEDEARRAVDIESVQLLGRAGPVERVGSEELAGPDLEDFGRACQDDGLGSVPSGPRLTL